jgi:hypothetical protein
MFVAVDESTEQIWRERVREYEASGLTAAEFARHRGFHQTTLSKYVRLFGRATRSGRSTSLALARVRPGTGSASVVPASGDSAIELVIGRGMAIRLRRGFDEQVLSAVVRVVVEAG